jgi:hypothetical protein
VARVRECMRGILGSRLGRTAEIPYSKLELFQIERTAVSPCTIHVPEVALPMRTKRIKKGLSQGRLSIGS